MRHAYPGNLRHGQLGAYRSVFQAFQALGFKV